MTTRARFTGEFTGWHMLAVMVAFFGVILAVNLTLAWFANSSWTGLITKDSYLAGQSYNEDLQKSRAQAALGYKGNLTASKAALEFTFLDREGAPIVAERIDVNLGRPADNVDDHVVTLEYAGAGRYVGTGLAPGLWQAKINAVLTDGSSWRQNWRFSVSREDPANSGTDR